MSGYMSYSLSSLKGVIYGSIIEVMKGDTRSLDYSSSGHKGGTNMTVQPKYCPNTFAC